jgi:hypothetical protein
VLLAQKDEAMRQSQTADKETTAQLRECKANMTGLRGTLERDLSAERREKERLTKENEVSNMALELV